MIFVTGLWSNQSHLCVGPPLPKRKWVATATIASLVAQESEAIAPRPEGGASVREGPSLSIPQSR